MLWPYIFDWFNNVMNGALFGCFIIISGLERAVLKKYCTILCVRLIFKFKLVFKKFIKKLFYFSSVNHCTEISLILSYFL